MQLEPTSTIQQKLTTLAKKLGASDVKPFSHSIVLYFEREADYKRAGELFENTGSTQSVMYHGWEEQDRRFILTAVYAR